MTLIEGVTVDEQPSVGWGHLILALVIFNSPLLMILAFSIAEIMSQ